MLNPSSPIFEIDSNFGKFILTIKDVKVPMWFGKYQTGKLAMYYAEAEGKVLIPNIPVIFVISEQDIPSTNFAGCQIYDRREDMFAVHADIMHRIEQVYVDLLMQARNECTINLH